MKSQLTKRSVLENDRPPVTQPLGNQELRNMQAIILIGIQAVGKSTFYHQYFENTHVRINLDMLKTRHREQILLKACIDAKQPFVVDNTNVTQEERERYIRLAKSVGFRILGYYFQSKPSDAIQRNQQRSLPKIIPDKAIFGTYKRLQLPSLNEGFDALYYVKLMNSGEFAIQEWNDAL